MYATKGGSLAGCRKRGSLRLHAKFPSLRLELGNAKRVFHNLPRLAPHCRALSRQGPEDLWPSLATPARPLLARRSRGYSGNTGKCPAWKKEKRPKSNRSQRPAWPLLVSSSPRWRGQQGIFGSLPLVFFFVSFLPPPASRVRFPPTSQRLFASVFGVFFCPAPAQRRRRDNAGSSPQTPKAAMTEGGKYEKSRAQAPPFAEQSPRGSAAEG